MVHVDETRCTGCGVCLPACPTGALSVLSLRQAQGVAVVDPTLCDDCQACIALCPNSALALVIEAEALSHSQPSAVAVIEPKIIPLPAHAPALWRRAVLPAVGSALVWMGREVAPRLAPLALDVLDSALDRRISRWATGQRVAAVPADESNGQKKRQRRRQRRGRS